MPNTDAPDKGVRVLSLDGGGAGVLSELLILERIMYQVQATLGSDTTPTPCDYFEVIGGSGTGGIIALMLGRLRMSITASILAYEKLQPKPKSGSAEQFKASEMEAALRQIFREEKMRDLNPHACKTFVCAMHESNLNAGIPQLFRSYDTPQEPALDCKIWEAARATSATPGLFKPIEIGRGGVRPKYMGGSVGHNNPTSLVVAEALQMYPSQPVVLVVSVGSGHPNTIQIPRSPSLTALLKTLKTIATDCERIHEDNAQRFRGTPNTYFRFNVLQGLQGFEDQHWGRSSEVSAHTWVYLGTEDAKSKLTGVMDVILNPVVPVSDSPAYLKVCPAPTVHFTGREDILQEMTEYFNRGIGQQHIFLLHGLGGSGKSQIAFKFVEESTRLPESRFSDIYFVDSSSQQTIENDLITLALAKEAGKTVQDALLWLSHQHREWLIVFNNADDIHLKLVQYFPSGSHGNILITSRNLNLGQVARAMHKVEQMALEEAIDLLLSAAQYDIMEDNNRDLGKRIVQKLHCFPLAVAQAGAYISPSRSLQTYLDLYESTRSWIQLLDQHPPQSEYGWSVYTTWQISFQKLSRQARELLELCSFIHHDGITEELFRQAASYKIAANGPTEADLQESLDFLAQFLNSPGSKWDSLKFIALTNELARFSLIEFQPALGDITFSIHPLVHEWCRAIVKVDAPTELCMHKLIGMSLSSRKDDFRFSHRMFPHLDALLFKMGQDLSRQPNILDTSFASQCLWVYHKEGKWRVGVRLGQSMLQAPSLQLNEHQTLIIQRMLAAMYIGSGMFPQAAELGKIVWNKQTKLLGEDHPDTLRTMANLAASYSEMG
ncbi:acyl transferase/acyl hydrolase/lysophospholipase [Mycena latifolia]|nr:acyl transferase/acyl hydrolase/lysophospholipase [Mycena latifolia]